MSRKSADATQMAQTQTQTTSADDGAGAASAVVPAPPPAPQAPQARDEHHGHGGLYRRSADGTRTLIARTKTAATAPADRAKPA